MSMNAQPLRATPENCTDLGKKAAGELPDEDGPGGCHGCADAVDYRLMREEFAEYGGFDVEYDQLAFQIGLTL